ncbi:DUF397 domain-containing protein [Streptomyces qinzhouensis]|uniref:DUF397 domain-containing protein n=1 Tax=Streptomyces qinzhouensis TaxID=2599401 RepID=A0A5B8JCS9_9ACTN|nr:DUF397 domain-containing protein [Streptomyces qinzhouensis]QDY78234.1 DUF397 domain-containing protein [Streptomyces qinzhouensis]
MKILFVAPADAWFKSSYSNDSGGACVEIADLTGGIGIRDSKIEHGPALAVTAAAWSSFVDLARTDTID